MYGFTLKIDDKASPELAGLADRLRASVDLAVAGAESLADLLRRHLKNLEDTRPNKMGWPRQHFWADAFKHVQNPTRLAGGASVTVNQPGLAQRYFGGDIVPEGHPFLAIPARAEAYGKNPRDFPNLAFVFTGPDRGILVEKGAEGGGVMFWLVTKVHQEADPSVLPTQQQMEEAIVQGATTRLRHLTEGNP